MEWWIGDRQRRTQLLRYAALSFFYFILFPLTFLFCFVVFLLLFFDFVSVCLSLDSLLSSCLSLFLLRLSRHGGWLINHVAASIEKPSPRCQRCGPHCFGYLSCLLSLGAVELFPGVNRDDDDTQKPKEKKHPTTELKCIFFQIQEKKRENKIKRRTKKKKKTKQMAAALLLLLSLEQVVMLFPFSIRQHISRHFTIGRVSSSFLYLHFLLFSFFGLSVFSSCFQDSYCCCCCLRLLPFILIPPSLRLVRSLHLSRARSD